MNKIIKELILTFSNEKSFLSSKKMERAITFLAMLLATQVFFYYHIATMSATDFITVVLAWLGYAGYNAWRTYKDKKLEKEEKPIDEKLE